MNVLVFTGPTLSAAEGRRELHAMYLPPAALGDVYRVALQRPRAIGIIDGYFECVPAVWHKEILFAMAQGIPVYGSASMGALRAVELGPFGMRGVGKVFEAYRNGLLEDDDEVAVTHGPAEMGYPLLSEANVDIRATLHAAEAAGVLRPAARQILEAVAKSLFFADRSYPAILRQAAAQGVGQDVLDALRQWLPHGRVHQKREDALAMLRVMREELLTDPAPKRVAFALEHTVFWDRIIQQVGRPGKPGHHFTPNSRRRRAIAGKKAAKGTARRKRGKSTLRVARRIWRRARGAPRV